METINRIRKQALSDEEVRVVRSFEQGLHEPEDAVRGRLQAIMDEAIPMVEDTQSLDFNLQKLRQRFNKDGYVVMGKVLSTKKVNLAEQTEWEYQGQKIYYPKEYTDAPPEGVALTNLDEYQINIQSKDGIVQLHVIPPNFPRNPNDKYEGQQA